MSFLNCIRRFDVEEVPFAASTAILSLRAQLSVAFLLFEPEINHF